MIRTRLPLLVLVFGLAASGAHAQNFFERLFGLTPSRPEPQRQAPRPQPPPPVAPPEAASEEPAPRRAPAAPSQARAVTIRAPSDDSVLGRELKQNGATGSLRIERTGAADYGLRMTLLGRKSAESPETCSISLGSPSPLALVSQGRPEGVQRFQLQDPVCPLQLDLLEESLLVKGPDSGVCVFQNLGCQADPSGLWGPEPAALIPRVKEFEALRASADKAARDNYKVMTQRARPEGVRPIVAEQAAFSADREQVCKSYAREAAHGFCNARYSEGRALSLAARLGLNVAAPNQTAETPRSRRSRVIDSDAAGPLPTSDDLMQPLR